MRLLKIPGVYGPCRDSELLAATIPDHVKPGDRVLDLFTGSGVQAIAAAQAGAGEVIAVDVARRAVAGVMVNALLNGQRVRARTGSMFEPVGDELFDVILANPPYVPSEGREEAAGPARAWEAGDDGRQFLDPLLEQAPKHLKPGGRLLIVHSSVCDELRTLAKLQSAGLDAEVVLSETAPLGPITAPRAEVLERRGLLQPGERTETTIVIRGAAPDTAEAPAQASSSVLSGA